MFYRSNFFSSFSIFVPGTVPPSRDRQRWVNMIAFLKELSLVINISNVMISFITVKCVRFQEHKGICFPFVYWQYCVLGKCQSVESVRLVSNNSLISSSIFISSFILINSSIFIITLGKPPSSLNVSAPSVKCGY